MSEGYIESKETKNTKTLKNNMTKNITNLYRLKKENELIKDRIIRDIKNLLEQEEEDYYKPVRVDNFYSN